MALIIQQKPGAPVPDFSTYDAQVRLVNGREHLVWRMPNNSENIICFDGSSFQWDTAHNARKWEYVRTVPNKSIKVEVPFNA